MKRILFVDDEHQILDAMRNILRKRRREWEMVFVDSGRAALLEMEKAPYDVIVSDMRMPEMDGAELLEQVCQRFPRTARFVLSGQADSESILRVLPFAQQFLSKPCDPIDLNRVIERTCQLQEGLSDQAIRDSVGGLTSLPTSNTIYHRLLNGVDETDVTVDQIVEIVKTDPAIIAKLLQLVNSAYFGLARKTPSIPQAISYLGLELVRSLIHSPSVAMQCDGVSSLATIVEQVQTHAFATAQLAIQLIDDPSLIDLTYTAALLHDVGLLGLAKHQPERYRETLAIAEMTRKPLEEVEISLGYVPHTAVGGYLLGVWGLPMEIVDCASLHHSPSASNVTSREITLVVHVADGLIEAASHPGLDELAFIDQEAISQAGYTDRIAAWLKTFRQNQNQTRTQSNSMIP